MRRLMSQVPYIKKVRIDKIWNPDYDPNAICVCGHPYERHFDSYDYMSNVGCKYCQCIEFACTPIPNGDQRP